MEILGERKVKVKGRPFLTKVHLELLNPLF